MGYQRGDRFGGDNRWREQSGYGRGEGRYGRDESRYERDMDYGRSRNWRDRDDDDRSFFERAGDQVRSWFRDEDEDYRGRERDRGERSYFGPERGTSYERDRSDRSRDNYRGDYRGDDIRRAEGGAGAFGGSDFTSDYADRRFDRIDAGSTGTQGVRPPQSPYGGSYRTNYGVGASGDFASSTRDYAAYGRSGREHDPHYSEWRHRQIESLDRDYDEYRREHQSKFEQEFGGWREKRRNQRQALGRVSEHMEVVGSDDQPVGTVDRVRGDRIILTKSDVNAGGHHHSIPCGWIDRVDDKVVLTKTADAAKRAWEDEDTSRALYEREGQGNDGPHALDRAFSGTY